MAQVSEVMRRYDVFFVHGIMSFRVPGNNSLLKPDIDWKTRLEILIAYNPTISTSTISVGDGPNRLWERMGVILNDGVVEGGWIQDAGSVARTINSRSLGSCRNTGEDDIRLAIEERTNHYNEFSVRAPEMMGFYYCPEQEERHNHDLPPLEQIVAETQKYGLPVYLLERGVLYEIDHQNRGRKITINEIIDRRWKPTAESVENLRKKFRENSPFRLRQWNEIHADYLSARFAGRESYIRIAVNMDPQKYAGQTRPYCATSGERRLNLAKRPGENVYIDKVHRGAEIAEGYPVTYVAVIRGGYFTFSGYTDKLKTEYFVADNRLFIRRVGMSLDGINARIQTDVSYVRKYGELYDNDRNRKLKPEFANGTYETIKSYLAGLDEAIAFVENKYENAAENKSYWRDLRVEFAYHLYGVAEQAACMSDNETAEAAREIAARIFPYEEYVAFIKSRFTPQGTMRMTEQDERDLGIR